VLYKSIIIIISRSFWS